VLVYPITRRGPTLLERIALKRFVRWPFFDNILGKWTISRRVDPNFRESIVSRASGSVNRHRQIASLLIEDLYTRNRKKSKSLKEAFLLSPEIRIYNTEVTGALHESFRNLKNYVGSEFLGPRLKAGQSLNGKRHEDLMSLSFPDQSFDFVISGDVFEHVPDPYIAHREVFRVLAPGGKHIFTVPFYQTEYLDEKRAYLDKNGKLVHEMEPVYHYDPVRPNEGVLVYNIFALEMLVKLKQIGFETKMHSLYQPLAGILGNNSIVFEACKP
jgi:hypothetical protein